MSSYAMILDVSRTLHATLWNGFSADNSLTQYAPNAESIVLMNPVDAAAQANHPVFWRLSLAEVLADFSLTKHREIPLPESIN